MEKKFGDLLEQLASEFIELKFCNYRKVWEHYVDNDLDRNPAWTALPDNLQDQREKFGEINYSILEACYLAYRITKSNKFDEAIQPNIDDFNLNDYLANLDSFYLFFTYIGRIHDLVVKASECLLKSPRDNSKLSKLHEFYQDRSIIIHGPKIPIKFDDCGLMQIPKRKTETSNGNNWDDKSSKWKEIETMELEYIQQSVTDIFDELIQLVNEIYGSFYDVIMKLPKEDVKIIPITNDPFSPNINTNITNSRNTIVSGSVPEVFEKRTIFFPRNHLD